MKKCKFGYCDHAIEKVNSDGLVGIGCTYHGRKGDFVKCMKKCPIERSSKKKVRVIKKNEQISNSNRHT